MSFRFESHARMLLNYFNVQTSRRLQFAKWGERFDSLLNEDASNSADIRKAIYDYASTGETSITGFLQKYGKAAMIEDVEDEEQPVQPIKTVEVPAQPMMQVNDSINLLSNIVAQMVAKMKTAEIQELVSNNLQAQIDQYILDTYGKIEKKVTLVSELGKTEIKGITHKKFETVLKFVANDEPVYLAGPAGSGKNVLCKQVAQALGLDFYFSNAVTQEYKLTGFTDANGTFHESQFYKAFTKGGLFMLDEMDASIPEVLIILNAAIANRYFDFPAPIGKVEANPNFRVIAAGNTYGYGADAQYVGRNTLDAASLDRFAMIEIDYDERIENGVTNGNTELIKFCHAFRKAANDNGLGITVSYRAMGRIAKMESLLGKEETLKTCLIKGLGKDDINMLLPSLQGCGEYTTALQSVLSSMK